MAEFRAYVSGFDPDRVAAICGVPRAAIIEAARLYATTRPAQIVTSAKATVQHSNGLQNHCAVLMLAAVTGNLDVEGGNRRSAPQDALRSVSLFAERIAHLPPRIGAARFPVWSNHYAEANSMLLAQAITGGEPYRLRSVLAFGMNVMMWPNTRALVSALGELDFFACADFFHTPTTRLADLVLPAATSLEREALVHKGALGVMLRQAAVAPEGEARGDVQVNLDLGCRLGMSELFWDGDYRESVRYRIANVPGLTVERLVADPSPAPVLAPAWSERSWERVPFATPSGRVELVSSELAAVHGEGLPVYREPAESPVGSPELAKRFPLVLTSGGRSRHFTHSQHRNVPSLLAREPHPGVQLHPADAAARGIDHGERVWVSSPRSAIEVVADVTDEIQPSVVHVFHGWAEANVNDLTSDADLDPISGFPPFMSGLCEVMPR